MSGIYAGPAIDPHHHLWDLSLGMHPWLSSPPGADGDRVFDNTGVTCRDYGVDDYLRDSASQNVVATVHVEAGWSDDFPLAETRWLDGLDKGSGVASRYVARVPLDSPRAGAQLEQEAANSSVVGIRDIVSWHPQPSKSFASRDGRMSDSRWRGGLRQASRFGLSFDLMLFPWQMDEALRLVNDFGDTQFVLNHCGSPVERGREGMSLWRDGLEKLASAPNLAIKVSNPVAYDHDWTLESLRVVIEHCLDCFGPSRSMFASDFPVAGLHASFDKLFNAFRAIAASLSPDEQEAVFFSTANRVYRMGLPNREKPQERSHL